MFGDLRASLYDLFGYLIPGITATAGVLLFLQLFATHPHSLAFPGLPIQQGWLSFLLLGYIVGHAVHALGNIVPGLNRSAESIAFSAGGLPTGLIDDAMLTVSTLLGTGVAGLPPEEQFAIIDEARVLHPNTGDRDTYVYREGFYRGMVVAMVILALSLVGHLRPASLCFYGSSEAQVCVARAVILLIILMSTATSWGFFHRMRRFGRYRVQRGLYQFLVAAKAQGGRRTEAQ
jgi:hypothetical protein